LLSYGTVNTFRGKDHSNATTEELGTETDLLYTKPDIENIIRLNSAVVKLKTVQMTKLPL
jgi:hypothetical protein